jgi:hypothetical protein
LNVEELIEELRQLPATALVYVRVRGNLSYDGQLEPLYEFRDHAVEQVLYAHGEAVVHLDENVVLVEPVAPVVPVAKDKA